MQGFFTSLLFILLTNICAQSDASFIITSNDIDPNEYFGITVANGMVGLVSSPEPMQVKDVVMNGVFDKYGRGRVENILKVFSHMNLELSINDQEADLETVENYTQSLDMRTATFITEFDLEEAHVKYELRSLRHLPFCQMASVIISTNKDVNLQIKNKIETPAHLRDNTMFFNEIVAPHAHISLQTSVAGSPTGRYELAATTAFLFEDHHDHPELSHIEWDQDMHYQMFQKKLGAGDELSFSLLGTTLSSEHVQDPHNEAERMTIYAWLEGKDVLVQKHEDEWANLWEGDIIIGDNEDDQREVRSALYHLYSFVREGSGYSMSPMGLSGLGYNGHVFWDTEVWMYPPLLVFHPQIARSLLDYRYDRLEAARNNALMHGYKGAMFPWESAGDGSEQTPVWALTGPFEHHITGDIAWSVWQYYRVTGDLNWMRNKGYALLSETADFWCSRVQRNGPGKYNIKNVVCADEYAENVDDNAFTNAGAILNLQYATQAAELLGYEPNPDWKVVADNIPILKNEDGVILEHATYDKETIKQADVNLLAHPFYFVSLEQAEKDLKFYEPFYDEFGPAMGFSTIATLYAQLGSIDKAYGIWTNSYTLNQVPPFGVLSETKGGENPYFATGAGGMLQTVLWGFGGLRIEEDGIRWEEQKIPSKWSKLEFKGVHKRNK